MSGTRSTLVRAVLTLLLISFMVVIAWLVPVKQYLAFFLEWVRSVGPVGPVLLACVYAIACVFCIPGSVLTLGAGVLFGVVRGGIAVSVGSVVGATLAFLVGRSLLRKTIEPLISSDPRFRVIDRAVEAQGFKIVLLTRLSPIFPFNLLNYAFGLTGVRLREYVLASWIGMIPGTLMYIYFGSALKSLVAVTAGEAQGGRLQQVFFVFGLFMTVVATVVITRVARRAIYQVVGEPDS